MWVGLLAYALLLLVLEYLHSTWLPVPAAVSGGRRVSLEEVARVRSHLDALTGLGPRVTGTPQLHAATEYLLQVLRDVRANAADGVQVEVELQTPSGRFHTEFLEGIDNVYRNVTNVLVRISSRPSDSSKPTSILVNAHYDSVSTSVGASDDAVACAVMLEAASALSRHPRRGQAPVVLLFNGAEELHQMAAHGFITRHRWAPSIRYLINLESIGGGGRELIFQCNSAQFINLYARVVPFPKGSIIAHELFHAVLWRSAATDWRTLVTAAPSPLGIAGIDSAYIANGHIYHTVQDSADYVSGGTIVNTLQNVEALLAALQTHRDELAEVPVSQLEARRAADAVSVFFTAPGMFFVAYSGATALSLHSVIAAAGLLYALCSGALSINVVGLEVLCFLAASLTGLLTGVLVSIIAPMRWYAHGLWLACALYIPPSALAVVRLKNHSLAGLLLHMSTSHEYSALSGRESGKSLSLDPAHRLGCSSVAALILLWSCLLALSTLVGVMSGYIAGFFVVFGALADMAFKYARRRASRSAALYAYLLCLAPALLHWLELYHGLLDMLLPLLGKSGTLFRPDPVVGLITGAFTSVVVQLVGAHVVRREKEPPTGLLRASLVVYLILLLGLAVFTSPYSLADPKRLWIQHVDREICTTLGMMGGGGFRPAPCEHDSGLWISAFDGLGLAPLASAGERFDGRYAAPACSSSDGACYARFPWSYPVAHLIRESMYIPRAAAVVPVESALNLTLTSRPLESGRRRIIIELRGPSHLRLVLRDGAEGRRLLCWAVAEDGQRTEDCQPPPAARFDGSRYMSLVYGGKGSCVFRVLLEVLGAAPVEVTAHADFVTITRTPELEELRAALPTWAKRGEWTNFASSLITRTA